MRRCAPLLLAGCLWIRDEDEAQRLDADGDGYPFPVDCNDERPDIGLVAFEDLPTLGCGDRASGAVDTGSDLLRFTQCLHPSLAGDLVVLRRFEVAWLFVAQEPQQVLVTLDASELIAEPSDEPVALRRQEDNGDVALLANRGLRCGTERCEVALPAAPAAWKDEQLVDWSSTVSFQAEAGEPWVVVVSGDAGAYHLDVACGG